MKFPRYNVQALDKPLDVLAESTRSHIEDEALYLCDLTDIVRKHVNWTKLLPRVAPFYAVKCNDSAVVLELLAALGAGFDCASMVEINKVKELGVPSSRIIFANPMKAESHLRAAVGHGICKMTFDSAIELHKIKRIYPSAKLLLRIRYDAKLSHYPLGAKFGCDPLHEAPVLLMLAKQLQLNVVGICFHVGSGCMDPPVFAKAIHAAKQLFEFAERMVGFRCTLLDIGGGFPGEMNTDLLQMAQIINAALDKHFPAGSGVQIIAEPGRYYVVSAFTLVTRIHSKREVCQNDGNIVMRMYFINDGVYGAFNGNIYNHKLSNSQIDPVPCEEVIPTPVKPPGGPLYKSIVWGPTCDSLDQVCDNVQLPDMDIGDLLLFENMGGYTLTIASTFNGFPMAVVKYFIEPAVVRALKLPAVVDAFIKRIL